MTSPELPGRLSVNESLPAMYTVSKVMRHSNGIWTPALLHPLDLCRTALVLASSLVRMTPWKRSSYNVSFTYHLTSLWQQPYQVIYLLSIEPYKDGFICVYGIKLIAIYSAFPRAPERIGVTSPGR